MKNYRLNNAFGSEIFICTDGANEANEFVITEIKDLDAEEVRAGFTFEIGQISNEGQIVSWCRSNNYNLTSFDNQTLLSNLYTIDSTFRFTVRVSAAQSFILPAAGPNNFMVDWGDGNTETVTTASPSHTYVAADDYQISISGSMPRFSFANSGSRTAVISLDNMGDTGLTSMNGFLHGCSNMTSANLNNFSAPPSCQSALRACSSLTNLQTTTFDVSKVTDMFGFVNACSSLVTFDTRFWDVGNVSSFAGFAAACSALETFETAFWDTRNVTNFSFFIQACNVINTLNTGDWDTGKVRTFQQFADRSPLLSELDVRNWNVSNVTTFFTFLNNNTTITRLEVRDWDVSNVVNFEQFADDCTSLTRLDVSNWDVRRVTNFTSFIRNTALVNIDTSNWVTAGNPIVRFFADGCTQLTSRINPNAFWLNTGITSFNNAFRNAVNIENFADIPNNWKGL